MQTLKRLYDFCQRKSRLQKKKRVVFLILVIILLDFQKLLITQMLNDIRMNGVIKWKHETYASKLNKTRHGILKQFKELLKIEAFSNRGERMEKSMGKAVNVGAAIIDIDTSFIGGYERNSERSITEMCIEIIDKLENNTVFYYQLNSGDFKDYRIYLEPKIAYSFEHFKIYTTIRYRFHSTPYIEIKNTDSQILFGFSYDLGFN